MASEIYSLSHFYCGRFATKRMKLENGLPDGIDNIPYMVYMLFIRIKEK